jgi:large subunit ribosomal protein L10
MARPEKVAVVSEVSERLQQVSSAVLTEYRGLDVDEMAQLRRQLREQNAEYRVVKNTLARRAVDSAGVDIPDELLTGPTALTFCDGDPVAASKVLKRFAERHPALVIKGGLVDGQLLDADQVRELAELESREELLARAVGLMNQLLAQPAQLAQAGLAKMARLLAAYQEQREAELEADGESASGGAALAEEPPAVESETAQESEAGQESEATGDGSEAADQEAEVASES